MSHSMPEHGRTPAQTFAPTAPASGGYTPQPGWYPDPQDAARVRFWDGQRWTLDSYPAPAAQASPYTPGPSSLGGYADTGGISGGSISGGFVPGYVPASGQPQRTERDAAHGPRRVGPIGAVTTAFTRVLDYGGRSSRREYWWMALAWVLIEFAIVFAVVSLSVSSASVTGSRAPMDTTGLDLVLYAVTIVVNLPLLVRRLHDTGRSGWWCLLALVPFGGLVLLVFTVQASQPGRNQYGPGPA
jgi:uncharacterized membrane protein YhaH (DUF805 family)